MPIKSAIKSKNRSRWRNLKIKFFLEFYDNGKLVGSTLERKIKKVDTTVEIIDSPNVNVRLNDGTTETSSETW